MTAPGAPPGPTPRVAVIGRQNVGKSTLVNRLFGRREAIAHETPGVTRDRIELEASWRGRRFGLVDTGGFVHGAKGIESLVSDQAERAMEDADVTILVVDGPAGILEDDARLARRLRRVNVPVLLVVNKVDSDLDEPDVTEFFGLGLGEPLAVSALHGRGTGDLLDRLVAVLPEEADAESPEEPEPRLSLVGRPNVGKSSLFNRLVGEERSVVFEDAGTTRDAVDALVRWPDGAVRFVDTAGLRRAARTSGVAYYGFVRTVRAIERSEVAGLVLDASEGFSAEDKRIAARVIDAGRGLIVVANKWDLVEEKEATLRELREQLRPFARCEVLRTSAVRGTGVARLPGAFASLRTRWASRAPTSVVNEIVGRAQDERPPPRGSGRYRYATQVRSGPPSLVLFGGPPPPPSYRRFLEGRLRSELKLEGVPIRLSFRPKRRRTRRAAR
jgi:GTPase